MDYWLEWHFWFLSNSVLLAFWFFNTLVALVFTYLNVSVHVPIELFRMLTGIRMLLVMLYS